MMERQGMQILDRPTLAISSLTALISNFIMSTGSLSPHYMKWHLGFVLFISSKNQQIFKISKYVAICSFQVTALIFG